MEDSKQDIFRQSFPDRYPDVANWVRDARLNLQYIDRELSKIPKDKPAPSLKPEWDKSSGFDEQAYTRHGLEISRYEIPKALKDSIAEKTKYEPEPVRQSMLENADYLIDLDNTHIDKNTSDKKTLEELGELEVYRAKITKDRKAWTQYDGVGKEKIQDVMADLSNLSRLYFVNDLDITDPANNPEYRGIDRLNNPLVDQIFEQAAEPDKDDYSMNKSDLTDPANEPEYSGLDRLNNPLVDQIFEQATEPDMDDYSLNKSDITDLDKD